MITRTTAFPSLLLIPLAFSLSASPLLAQPETKRAEKKGDGARIIEVEVKRDAIRQTTNEKKAAGDEGKALSSRVELEYVTFNRDKSLLVGYFQDGWFEMVSLHDAETKKQLASVYCDGGVPTVFRFSKDNRFLGAKTGVGWYVWKIPSFEKVFVLGDIDIDRLIEGTKVDPSTSGPVHPNTEEAATKTLEKIGANAPEGLRVHPVDPKKGTKVDPSTSGPIHPNTEEAARKALRAAGGDAPGGPKVSPADSTRHNGLEIQAKAGGELAAGKTVKVTVTLKNHNKTPMQTFAPPKSMCNVVWKLRFDPPLHDAMGGNHTMFPSVTYDKVATIQPGKQVEFTFELTRKKNKIFVESECGKFGCLSEPVRIPKGTKELKLFYLHEDSGSDWYARAGDDEHIKFTEKRWSGTIRTQPVVVKLP